MIPCQRHLFEIPEGVIYMNCAYMSPLMRAAAARGRAGLDRKMQPWNIHARDFFNEVDKLRACATGFFQCRADDVAVVASAGYGLETAAANLPLARGQKVLVLEEQYPSNYYPWVRLAQKQGGSLLTVPLPTDGDWTSAVLGRLNENVAIAALPHVQWTTGGILDLVRIGEECRRLGIALALDLTQSLGVYPFDAGAIQPDFAVAAAYKWLMGPYGLGLLYVAPKWQRGVPLEENWISKPNAEDFSALTIYSGEYAPGARRYDVSQRSNFATLPAAIAALEQLQAWGIGAISHTLGTFTRQLIERLKPLSFQVWPERFRAPHYLCLRSSVPPPPGVVEKLAAKQIYISVRGPSIRITPHVYNTVEEIEKVSGALLEIMGKKA